MAPPRTLHLTADQWSAVLAHLWEVYPQEGCGFLAGQGGRVTAVYPVPNRLASAVAFEMEPAAQINALLAIEQSGAELLAIYHSHPHTAAHPSPTDITAAAHYPEAGLFIVSLVDETAGYFVVGQDRV